MTKKEVVEMLRLTHPCELERRRLLVSILMTNYRIERIPIYFPKIYRVRPVEYPGLIKTVDQLWSPPEDRVKSYGRANIPGNPVFYASENKNTSLIETTPNGQVSLCLELVIRDGILKPFHFFVGPCEKLKNHGVSIKYTNDPVVECFLEYEFRRQRDGINDSPYEYSSLISEIFFKCEKLDGLIYPSVPFGFKFLNIAFRPTSVDKMYVPKNVEVFVGWMKCWAKVGSGRIINNVDIVYQSDKKAIYNLPSIDQKGIDMLNSLFV
jgi:hypothetical protein